MTQHREAIWKFKNEFVLSYIELNADLKISRDGTKFSSFLFYIASFQFPDVCFIHVSGLVQYGLKRYSPRIFEVWDQEPTDYVLVSTDLL